MADYISQINLPSGAEYKISAERLKQTALTSALNTFTNSTDLIYTAKGGGNNLGDKPTGVDAFGLLSFKTAEGWYGQLLMSSNTSSGLYWRTATSLSGGWNKLATTSDIPTNLSQLTNGPGYTTNQGTVTTISTGSGLTGGDITTTGTISHSNSITAKSAYSLTATTASANGGTIKVTDLQYDACGHITASTDRTITLSQTTYNFSGVSFTSGNSSNGTHAADSITSNGHWYYSSQGPASTLGAQSTDGALYTQAHSTSWVGQIAQDYRDGQLFVRSKKNNAWQDWLAIPMFTTTTGGLGSASKPIYIDTSGKLQECTNSIPTKISDLTNDSTFVSSSGVTSITIKTSSPLTGGSNTATTSTGTYTIGFSNQNKNLVLAGPSTGSAAAPTFRALVASDLPTASTSQAGVTTLSAAADDSSKAATAKSVYDLTQTVNGIVSAADALVFKGTITGKATTQNSGAGALTLAANCGDTYMVDTAGYVNGLPVEIGDLVICLTDNTPAATTSGNNKFDTANIRNKWTIIQTNVDSALFKGTNTFTDGHILIADGANGKVKDSGFTIKTSVPENAVFTDTNNAVTQTGIATDASYPVLFKNTANTTDETTGINYSNNVTSDATTTKPITINPNSGLLSVPQLKISIKSDSYGLFPHSNNYNQIGSSSLYWYRAYITNYYGTTSNITNWAAGKNIGTPSSSSAAATLGSVNFYNTCAKGGTQTKTLLTADSTANSNITLTLPKATGTIALTSDNITGSAASWTNARKVYTALGTASTTTTINGGTSDAAAIGIGVDGTLGVGNGGTGVTTTDDIFATYGVEYIVGTQTAKTNAWKGNTYSTALYEGKTIAYYLPYAGTSSKATLELTFPDGTTSGAKAVYAGNTQLTTHYPQYSIMIMVWNGTNWRTNPFYYSDTNNFASIVGYYNNVLARVAIAANSIIVGDSTGYERVASGVTFDITYPIIFCNKAVAAAASNYANMYLQNYDLNIATIAKSGFTSAANKVIYLVVTIIGDTATVDSTIITDTLPSTDDGKVYIVLGKLGAQSTGANYFFFHIWHPMFWYKDGKIQPYTGYATATSRAAITTTANAIAYYSDTTGTFAKLSSAKGALYATSTNGALAFGKLPVGEGGTGCDTLTSGELLVGNGTSAVTTRGIYTLSAAGTAGWDTTANRTKIPDMSFIAYWNGAYQNTSSNIQYVGTIKGGTWQGTAIAASYIGEHSTAKLTSGTLGTARGGLGNNSFTASRLLYTESATKISSTTSIYAGTDSISINATAAPANSGKFQVKGTSTMQHILPEADTTYDLGDHASLRWRTAYLTTSLCVSAKNVVNAYNTNGKGTFLGPAVMSICQTAAGDGLYIMGASQQYARMYIETIGTASAGGTARLDLGNAIATGTAKNSRGLIRIYNTNANYTDYQATGLYSGTISTFNVIGQTSTTKDQHVWSILALGNGNDVSSTNSHTQGALRIYSMRTTYTDIRSQDGYSKVFYLPKYNGDMYAIHAGNNNAIGSGKKPVYIAANGRVSVCDTTVGSAYQPVYSNAGELTASYPVQYSTWTINSGHTKSTLTASGIFTANTYVIALVVTSGESDLNGPLTWTSATDTLTITTTEATSGAVSGQVLTAIGTATGATNASSAS